MNIDARRMQTTVSAGGVDERADVHMLRVRGTSFWRDADKAAFDSAPDDRYEKLTLYTRAALTASAQSVPDGWKLVPEEATPAMLDAAWNYHSSPAYTSEVRPDSMTDAECYRAMLAAAPAPGKGGAE